ncbi:MAG TPA: S53 family peptidase [Streptosporangiaceae bacterium]|nr:S53 family peptidase [Streptosporangiaceae bacterium]
MRLLNHPIRAGAVAVLGLAMTAATGAMASSAAAATPASRPAFSALARSVVPTTDKVTGAFTSSHMAVEIALAPRNQAGLNRALTAAYTKGSGSYHQWLARGQFDKQYAPAAASRAAVVKYLRGAGLQVSASASPFLVRASGSSAQVSAAFRTRLSTYRDKKGISYFSNSSAVSLPSSLVHSVQGVIGLSNTVREHSMVQRMRNVKRPAAKGGAASASCEGTYPTTQQAVDLFVNGKADQSFGYGGGPGCSGLTPAQDNSLYGAPNAGRRGQGAGATEAVFELSAYQHSDISTWAQTFYGKHYNAPLMDVNVDGGPLNPACPVGDTCPPDFNGYAGDIEVDADIEVQLAIAPHVKHLIVYNAPNDFTGQTELDEYTAIARADQADVVSSSWAVCENDVPGAGYVQAENTVFEQMALQGQSMFGAEGDTGAFSCIRSDGTTILNVLDPPSQPWVTSVGGTSFETDNPGTNPHPAYPSGVETVWNVDNLCSNAASSAGGQSGFFWCAQGGAGGGGSSQWWGRPAYQFGKGVNNQFTTTANGTTQCALAKAGTPCREDPDISANADEFTPYAEFCTGSADTPESVCGTFSGGENPPGWFGIGGTSLSSPLWSAIIADRDSYTRHRSGNINPLLYALNAVAPGGFLHDITGTGQTTNNNGLFPTTPGYDEATGLGTPRMAQLITGRL